ncbi:MAG: exo-alpha-sialidase [Clostridia bacterium]|nr:exo-alpha-sialidase [Clostridia bacterium]
MSQFTGSFQKHEKSPVFGSRETGTMFDAYVWHQNGRLRMDISWRPKDSLAVTFSDDGVTWEEPIITLGPDPESDWERMLNRNCVLPNPHGDGYLMWYTGQVWENGQGVSAIGVAKSDDGIHFERLRKEPVLVPEAEFERESVMNPFVMYENGKFRMWYAAGETYEPNVICYAESADGISWDKHPANPIFTCNPEKEYEQNRIGAVQILPEGNGYLMFYIGYRDIHTACICAARSADGVTNWQRVPENPLVTPTPGTWDEDSCYKPGVVRDEEGTYHIWYNGRRKNEEYIGYATGRIAPKTE